MKTSEWRSLVSKLRMPLHRGRARIAQVGWTLAERVWMLISGVIIGFWVVRTLGPADFGHFSAALSVASVFAGLSIMGLDTALVRRLTSNGGDANRLVAAAAHLRLGGSIAYITVTGMVAVLLFPGSDDVALMAVVVAAASIFRVSDTVGLWLNAQNRFRDAAIARITVRVLADTVRVALILHTATALWFALAMVAEAAIAFALFSYLGRNLWQRGLRIDKGVARSLLSEGKPVVISGLLAALYARVDQIVLYSMSGAAENGYYAAAARVSETFNVIVVSISMVAAAHFGRLSTARPEQFDAELRIYYRSMVIAGTIVSAIICGFAGPIVNLLFGPAFASHTAEILRVHAWTVMLVFASVALEPWFYHYGQLGTYVPKTLLTFAFSVPAVLVGTFGFGAVGTATAVVVTYAVSVFLSNLLLPKARGAFAFQLNAFRQ